MADFSFLCLSPNGSKASGLLLAANGSLANPVDIVLPSKFAKGSPSAVPKASLALFELKGSAWLPKASDDPLTSLKESLLSRLSCRPFSLDELSSSGLLIKL